MSTTKRLTRANTTSAVIPAVPVPALNTNALPTNANVNTVNASVNANAVQTSITNANQNSALVSIPKVPFVTNWTKTSDQLRSLIDWLQQMQANSSLQEPEMSRLMSKSAEMMLPQMIRFVDTKVVNNYLASKNKQRWEDLEKKDLFELLLIPHNKSIATSSQEVDVVFKELISKVNFEMIIAPQQRINFLTESNNILMKNCNLGETYISHTSFSKAKQESVVDFLLSDNFDLSKQKLFLTHIQLLLKSAKNEIKDNANPYEAFQNKFVDVCTTELQKIEAVASIFQTSSAHVFEVLGDKKSFAQDTKTYKPSSNSNSNETSNKEKRKLENKEDCNICGNKHEGANISCVFFSHPNANRKQYKHKSFAESDAGKEYINHFKSKNLVKLTNLQIDGNEFDFKAARTKMHEHKNKKIKKGNFISLMSSNCLSTIKCNNHNCQSTNKSINYLLSSFIQMENNNLLPISAFLDSGTTGHGQEANILSRKLFDIINVSNKNLIYNLQTTNICSDIIDTCEKSMINFHINFIFTNQINNQNETINIPVYVLPNPKYDLTIGWETIIKYRLTAKLVDHFKSDLLKWPEDSCTKSSVGAKESRRHEPTNLVVSSASSFFSSINISYNHTKFNKIIHKSDLLDEEFRDNYEDDIYENIDMPSYTNNPTQEIDQIKYQYTERFNSKAKQLVLEFRDQFSTRLSTEPARIDPMIIEVDTSKWQVKANQGPPRVQTLVKENFIIKTINEYLEWGVIEESNAPYYSQLHLVPKPRTPGQFRVCIDFRNLNLATTPSRGVIPNIQDMIQRIGSKRPKLFSKMDLVKGYHQAAIAGGSREFTAFTSCMGVFQWKRVPMGLMNAGGHFQRQVAHHVFTSVMYNTLEVYIDDLFTFTSGETQEEIEDNHLNVLRQIFTKAKKHNILVNPEKTILGNITMELCGHMLSNEGVSFSPEKLNLVEEFELPELYEDLKRFVGVCNYFRTHVKQHSIVTSTMDKALHDYQSIRRKPVVWTDELRDSYNEIKYRILHCPTLYYVRIGDQYTLILEVDASELKGLGGYLFQIEKDSNGNVINEFPIAFVSHAWSKQEEPWGVPDKEAYAIIYCIRKLTYFLSDSYFLLRTDHKNITFINFYNNPRQKRWKIDLQALSFDISYIKGSQNIVADWASRTHKTIKFEKKFNPTLRLDDNMTVTSSCTEINTAYRLYDNPKPIVSVDPNVSTVWVNSTSLFASPTSLHQQENIDDSDSDDDQPTGTAPRLRIPESHFRDLTQCHNCYVGHVSMDLTYDRVLRACPQRWTSPKTRKYVRSFVKRCPFCLKMLRIKLKILSSPFVLSTYNMFERVAFDTVGPLPESADGYKYILVFIDCFSRWAHLFALRRLLAKEAAEKMIQYIGIYGSPKQWLSDQGTQFKNDVHAELNKLLGIDHQFSTAYSSEENGIVERVNQEVMNKIRAFIFHKKFCYNWSSTDLPLTQRLLNSRVHSRTGVSPAQLVMPAVDLDRNIILQINDKPVPLNGQPTVNPISDYASYDFKSLAQQVKSRYTDLALAAKESLLTIDNKHIDNYPTERTEFPAGSYVLVSFKSKDKQVKLSTTHRGPLQVTRQVARNTFNLKNLITGKPEEYSRQDLVPYDTDIERYNPVKIAEADKFLLEIESVVSHKPNKNPKSIKSVNELSFIVQWAGYESEDDRTEEFWETNKSIHHNRVILRYMRDHGLSKFIPKNIKFDESIDSDNEN